MTIAISSFFLPVMGAALAAIIVTLCIVIIRSKRLQRKSASKPTEKQRPQEK